MGPNLLLLLGGCAPPAGGTTASECQPADVEMPTTGSSTVGDVDLVFQEVCYDLQMFAGDAGEDGNTRTLTMTTSGSVLEPLLRRCGVTDTWLPVDLAVSQVQVGVSSGSGLASPCVDWTHDAVVDDVKAGTPGAIELWVRITADPESGGTATGAAWAAVTASLFDVEVESELGSETLPRFDFMEVTVRTWPGW